MDDFIDNKQPSTVETKTDDFKPHWFVLTCLWVFSILSASFRYSMAMFGCVTTVYFIAKYNGVTLNYDTMWIFGSITFMVLLFATAIESLIDIYQSHLPDNKKNKK